MTQRWRIGLGSLALVLSSISALGAAGTGTVDPVAIVARGNPVDIAKVLVPGRVTIVDFYSEYCGPCMKMAPQLEDLARSVPLVVLRKVDVNREGIRGIDWRSPVVQQHQIRSLPHIVVYDEQGNKVVEGPEASDFVLNLYRRVLELQ